MSPGTDRPWALLVAGGGTGGHLFPALAVREAIVGMTGGEIPTLWLCSNRPVDERILSAHGQPFEALPARPLSAKPMGLLKFAANWAPSVRAARQAIRRLKAQHERVLVLSTGGFAAAPVVQAARVEQCPVSALVLDAPPGKATRWIVRHSAQSFDATLSGNSGVGEAVGPIVRKSALANHQGSDTRAKAASFWGFNPCRPVLLVTGGSLGAKSLNDFVAEFMKANAEDVRTLGWQVLHQAGGDQGKTLEATYRELCIDSRVETLLDPMGSAWAAADLAICRAGAGTVAEVAVNGVPAAFMPYPHHRDRHQTHNARPLVEAGGAELWDDQVSAKENLRLHAESLLTLLRQAEARESLREGVRRFGAGLPTGGASRIATALIEQISL